MSATSTVASQRPLRGRLARWSARLRRVARVARDCTRPASPCPLCKGATRRRLAYLRVFNQCRACSFIFAITYDREVSTAGMGFEGSWSGAGGGGYREYFLARQVHDDLDRRRILLFGTGNTPTFDRLRDEGLDVTGCDISRDVVAHKQGRFGREAFVLPEQLAGLPPFDAIVAVEVIEHLLEPRVMFEQLFDRLTPDGVVCGTSNFWLGGSIVDGNRPGYMSHLAHVAYWSPRSLAYIARCWDRDVSLHEMVRPGSQLPDERFGQLWPNKRVFFIFDPRAHGAYFADLRQRLPVLPIDQP
jgi:SAM-dependent methyltransferase